MLIMANMPQLESNKEGLKVAKDTNEWIVKRIYQHCASRNLRANGKRRSWVRLHNFQRGKEYQPAAISFRWLAAGRRIAYHDHLPDPKS